MQLLVQMADLSAMALSLPPCSLVDEVRCDGDRAWIIGRDSRQGGIMLIVLAVVTLGVGVLSLVEPGEEEGVSQGVMVAIGVLFFCLPLGVAGTILALANPRMAMIDLATQRVHRTHWRTGEPTDSQASRELLLFVERRVPDGDDPTGDDELVIWARTDEPRGRKRFSVRLWHDRPADELAAVACLDTLRASLPWKSVRGDLNVASSEKSTP